MAAVSHRIASVVLVAVLVLPLGAQSTEAATIAAEIDAVVAGAPSKRAIWGIDVEQDDGTVVYARNAQTLLVPASVRKLFAAAAVTDCVGLDATIPTEIWIDGRVIDGVLQGNVVVRGYGDPSLAGRFDAGRARLLPLVTALHAHGIRSIRGGVIADVSRFGGDVYPPTWEYGDLGSYYAPPVDALAFNENVVGVDVNADDCPRVSVTTDPAFVSSAIDVTCAPESTVSIFADARNLVHVEAGVSGATTKSSPYLISVHDAGLFAAQALDDLIRRQGIAISDAPSASREPRSWSERVAVIQSPVVAMLLTTMLQNSQNLYAEMLLKSLAPATAPATYDAALVAERLDLAAIGVPADSFRFVDGSGLSSHDLATPAALVAVLRHLGEEPRHGAFDRILATPGGEGTLRRRLADLGPAMRGKSGTIGGVASLAGWIYAPDGQVRYFAIVVNHHTARASQMNAVIDEIVRVIAKY